MLSYFAAIILFILGLMRNNVQLLFVSAVFAIAFAIECNAPPDPN